MNKKKILDAGNALDNIKEKSAKLSSIVSEFDVIKNDLSNLKDEIQKAKKINKDSKAELSKLNKTVDEVQDKLISEIRVRIAEGAAEQTSRIKDANEKNKNQISINKILSILLKENFNRNGAEKTFNN